jgi:transcriptional regulator with XRE-family HTH domain
VSTQPIPIFELRALPDGRTGKGDRFWTRVDRTPGHGPQGECWPWMGSRKNVNIKGRDYDYGQLGFKLPSGVFRPIGAHVCSFFLTRGHWPEKGMHVCHTCDYPPCVRPDHLFEGTPGDNLRDAQAKGRMKVAAPKPPKDTRVKLRPDQLVKVQKARKGKGLNIYEVAFILGMDYTLYHKFEAGLRPSLTAEQFNKLKDVLSLGALKVSESQFYEHGHPGIRPGKKGDLVATAKRHGARMFRPNKAWFKLPPAHLGLYRADLIRAALLRCGAQFSDVTKAAGVDHYSFKNVLNGVSRKRADVVKVLTYAGLSQSEVYATEKAKAA